MPLGTQTSKLAQGFVRIFDPDTAPLTTTAAAAAWARIYADWALAGGVADARLREPALASGLAQAFNPALAGGGPSLFVQALTSFWIGLAVPEQAAVGFSVIPTGSVNSPQPDDATIDQQANGLAQVVAAFTLSSVKLQLVAPPNTIIPLV